MVEIDSWPSACATAIRPYLADLVGPGWEDVDHNLAELIILSPGFWRDEAIKEALQRYDRTAAWAREFLSEDTESHEEDPEARTQPRELTRGYWDLPGISPVGAPFYFCRIDGYRWRQRDQEERVPQCPKDNRHPPLTRLEV